ncbi:hypothetical protein GH714_017614 [Hevea brasiliensis]|uniref:GST C-terminal domain-containing protein n=1 Tax=Hevea brasiliensis TaxID=3981 RepID=A0A6A6MFS9_HEVBR|nr:hypothetical protein GH714_017614 [Hevea brasiliensis]
MHLASNSCMVGHSVTFADIIMTCNLTLGFSWILTKSFTSEFPHVERYFWTMVNQPNFRKIFGEVKQAESVPPVQSAKKFSQPNERAKSKTKDEPKKEAKKETKKEPTKPKEVASEEEEAPKPKPKILLIFCLQRMDLARKYAFGKMLVIGSQPPFKVKGLWVFRGQEIPQFVIDECYDMELYEWKKVDIIDESQKEKVNQMIEDHEPFEGEDLLDAKCFK